MDDCFSLKHKIQDLIDDGRITVKPVEQQANIARNLFLQHEAGGSVNAVTVEQEEAVMAINQHPRPKWVGNSSS